LDALFCARHAKQAEVYERIDLLRGIVLSSELCLRTVSLRSNRNRNLLLRGQRARATRELDLAYENLRRFEDNDLRASDSGQELGARPCLTRSSIAERRRRGAASYTIGPANSLVFLAKRLKASTFTTKMWRRLSSTAPVSCSRANARVTASRLTPIIVPSSRCVK
jgi:hypothetical protein